ncbi:MAG: TetR/AcrR family transcriptional regulator [Chloroflexi bacterium]|nr:TetR/AcrR family transcriptional regulator [Chloroflexota bacterium]
MDDRVTSMMDEGAETTAHAGGRPRSPQADRAIMDAAVRVLTEEGYARISVERIAAEAGVGKTTIYRRYRDRQELAAAAAVHVARHPAFDASENIDARAGLVQALAQVHQAVGSTPVLSMLGTLLAERPQTPAHLTRFWEHVLIPHQAAVRSIIERGLRRGDVKRGARPEVVSETLVGAFLARELSGLPVTSQWIESVVAILWEGVASVGPRARRKRKARRTVTS